MIGREQEKKLARQIFLLWNEMGTRALEVEVGFFPRDAGGVSLCLCVNFAPREENKSEIMIRCAIDFLVRLGITRQLSGVQFAVNRISENSKHSTVAAKYFLDSGRLREIENSPDKIMVLPIGDLVTTKFVYSPNYEL